MREGGEGFAGACVRRRFSRDGVSREEARLNGGDESTTTTGRAHVC